MEQFKDAPNTYATRANAIKAVEKKGFQDLRYVVAVNEAGRFFPVFIGQEAVHEGVHFHFCVGA